MSGLVSPVAALAVPRQDARAELRGWALLALASLGTAGVFALLLAMSRVPGVQSILPMMVDFFRRGLVIHVVFAFVVWLLTMFALLTSIVTHQLADRQRPRLGWAGAVGQALTMAAFPLLFLPSFLQGTHGFLNNYVPVIGHPMYMTGLTALYGGVLLPVLRLFANLPRRLGTLDSLPLAMLCGAFIYIVALLCLVISAVQGWDQDLDQAHYEALFWGGGHVFSFLDTLLMLTGWQYLGRLALGREFAERGLFRVAMILLAGMTIPAPILEIAMRHSPNLPLFFTNLQYGLAAPTLFVAVGGIAALMAAPKPRGWIRTNPPLIALLLSMAVFTVGGLFGFVVNGHDTRTPAHYHAMIAGLNLTLMGWFLFAVPALIGRRPPARLVRTQLLMFGIGQFIACIGLFWAGDFGAPRKIAGQAQGLIPTARLGMYLNGIGALIAVTGGIIFVWMAVRSVASSRKA